MRDYSKVGPQFWIGATGKKLRKHGMKAQLVAMYLMTCPHANMLGMYYLPLIYIAHECGLTAEEVDTGLQGAIDAGFCQYDDESEMVWVCEMAAYQIADALLETDKRCVGVQNDYNALPENPFLPAFYEKYKNAFHMQRKRGGSNIEEISPIEAPCKTLRSQEQEQEQEQKQEQEQEQRQSAPEPVASAAPKKSKLPQKIPLPDGFSISDRVKRWAEEKQIRHLQAHFENFVGACRAKGYVYVDWDDALMGAIRNDWAKLAVPQARASPLPYESAKDRSRREAMEILTGRKTGDPPNVIDIN